ncbi:hypothetical protein cypCar_00001028 [Cyprinus carpio]|nr:hypothetical protein cypCar_00001028 [Cyprinus carpio]
MMFIKEENDDTSGPEPCTTENEHQEGTNISILFHKSFSGRGLDGQALVFLPRHPCYPSQHDGKLELSHIRVSRGGQTHSRDVHGPKDIIPHYILHGVGLQNRTQNSEGFVMKEVTNPAEATLYQTTYQTVHCTTSKRYQTNEARGQPVRWHSHNIITEVVDLSSHARGFGDDAMLLEAAKAEGKLTVDTKKRVKITTQ